MILQLSDIFDSGSIKLNLEAKTKEAVFSELVNAIAVSHPDFDCASMLASLWERENKLSTGIASGVAIPHAFCRGIDNIVGAIGVSKAGIEYGALDSKPVYVVFMLAIGAPASENHLHILNKIFSIAQSEALLLIRKAQDAQAVQAILSRISG